MFYTGAWVTWTTPVAFSIQTGVPYLYHPSSTALVTAFNIYNTKVPTPVRFPNLILFCRWVTQWTKNIGLIQVGARKYILWTGDINFHSEFPVDQIWTDGFTGFFCFCFVLILTSPLSFCGWPEKETLVENFFLFFFKRRKSLLGYWQPLWIAFLKTFYLLHLMVLKGTLGVTWKRVDGMYSRTHLFLTLTCLL